MGSRLELPETAMTANFRTRIAADLIGGIPLLMLTVGGVVIWWRNGI